MVTVVDAYNFFKDFSSPETLVDREMTDIEDDFRTIVNLLTDQVEFANVIVLNKTDLVSKEDLGVLKSALKKLNPGATIVESSFCKVDPKVILNTGLFNFEKAEQSAGWIEELNKDKHTPETEEYGISAFVYRSKKPFDAERFWKYVSEKFPATVIRSKGLFWLSSRPDQALIWGQAGGSLRADSAGVWWCSMPFEQRTKYVSFIENQQLIESDWDKNFGDRKNEIVFIGQDMNEDIMRSELDACLIASKELDLDNWREGYQDSWPVARTQVLNGVDIKP
ncbi:hypothetical protein DNU06_07020 [Putridiphycobacter roseus]|uniref:CobW C-terminal domain-containing protein n=2 Tax=Putridiphycobacter roseus TaxID=2219161 RepID=A0A2W1N1B3_9FLAO|nr:GTP-binding protein [Putridiphycobacter roseus]PZE17574.1 hypothetical protein DNU06_07020 [Putridiphycobacter roseus]